MAVALVSTVTAFNDWSKGRQFAKLSDVKNDRVVKVLRGGTALTVSTNDVVVGDVCTLDTGDQVPADGLFLAGHGARTDESVMTGEALTVKVGPGNPFMMSGTQVAEGVATMMVTAVGPHSEWGQVYAHCVPWRAIR